MDWNLELNKLAAGLLSNRLMCLYRSFVVLGLFGLSLLKSLCAIVQKQGGERDGAHFSRALPPSCCLVFISAVAADAYPQV